MSTKRFDDNLGEIGYEIVDELQIRKQLEELTGWRFEFKKGERYGYDLKLYRWADDSNKPDDKDLVGYFELERARKDRKKSWITGPVPKHEWYFYSILKRKVYEFEPARGMCPKSGCSHERVTWHGIKKNARRTIFLKFNHNMDNCYAVPLPVVYEEGEKTKKSIECDPKNSYRKLDIEHGAVKTGVEDVVSLIDDYLFDRQSGIGEFG